MSITVRTMKRNITSGADVTAVPAREEEMPVEGGDLDLQLPIIPSQGSTRMTEQHKAENM
jgi:hypothetical protein